MAKPTANKNNQEQMEWSNLIGFERDFERLSNLRQNKTLPQAMLFIAPEGSGKAIFLQKYIASFGCDVGTGCGDCGPCNQVKFGANSDVLQIGHTTGRINVEDVGSVQEHLLVHANTESRKSGLGRLAVIYNAQNLTIQATNRLLKILEEPPEGARLWLTASSTSGLLPTLLSRAVKWRLTSARESDISEWLKRCHSDKLEGRSDDQIASIIRIAGNSPGGVLAAITNEQDRYLMIEKFNDAGSDGDLILLAEKLAKSNGLEISEFLLSCEISLNKQYKGELAGSRPRSPAESLQRRKVLRRVERAVLKSRTAVNKELTLNVIGHNQ